MDTIAANQKGKRPSVPVPVEAEVDMNKTYQVVENNITPDVAQASGVVEEEPKKVTFLSLHRSPMFFIAETNYVTFSSSQFETTDKEKIEFLRKHPQLNVEFWEGSYPDWVIEKKKKDKEWIRLYNEEEQDEL